jgi:hypothetical protein
MSFLLLRALTSRVFKGLIRGSRREGCAQRETLLKEYSSTTKN